MQQGDTVTVTAHGLYPQAVRNNFWFSLVSFVTNLLQPAPGSSGGPDPRRGRPGLPLLQVGVATGLPLLTQLSNGVPKGYLRVLVFDRDSALVSQQTEQLQGTALNNYDSLRIRVLVPQDGYVSAYVGNESDVDVYFDDIRVVHGQGLQVQESEYDPTGLELAGLTGTTPGLKRLSQYKWNGKEFQSDLGLNWTQLDWRMFDPQLDHLPMVDPEVENGQESMSPYAFGYDNAVRFNDPNGRKPDGGGGGLPDDFVARGFYGVGMSAINLVALSWAMTLNTPYKYQQNFVENSAGTAVDVETRKVPREGLVQDLKSAAWDVFNVTLAAVGGAAEGKLLEQTAGKAGASVAAQEVRAAPQAVTTVYKRPNYSVTRAQRASVQGKPCVTCGKEGERMIADHKTPLVQEHYTTGKIDKVKMRDTNSVQPQCKSCSDKQGAEMAKYSKAQKKANGL